MPSGARSGLATECKEPSVAAAAEDDASAASTGIFAFDVVDVEGQEEESKQQFSHGPVGATWR